MAYKKQQKDLVKAALLSALGGRGESFSGLISGGLVFWGYSVVVFFEELIL